MTRRWASARVMQALAIAAGLGPSIGLGVAFARDALGANPVETITHVTGDWALRFLLLCLCVSPLRKLTGWHAIAGLRRTLGLTAFFYATLHFTTFVALDLEFDPSLLGEELRERPYITMGFTAFCLLVPLAVTSTRGAIRRLAGRWVQLHRLVYVAAVCAIVHYFWLVKADLRTPSIYAGVLAVLLVVRIPVVGRCLTLARPSSRR